MLSPPHSLGTTVLNFLSVGFGRVLQFFLRFHNSAVQKRKWVPSMSIIVSRSTSCVARSSPVHDLFLGALLWLLNFFRLCRLCNMCSPVFIFHFTCVLFFRVTHVDNLPFGRSIL